jgi:hypothetical protein
VVEESFRGADLVAGKRPVVAQPRSMTDEINPTSRVANENTEPRVKLH